MLRSALARTPIARSKRFARGVQVRPVPGLKRLGSSYGGWTVPVDAIGRDSVCYSAGVGTDVTFDVELIKQAGCSVYGFDPTPGSITYVADTDLPPDYHFFPYALCGSAGPRTFYPYNPRDGSFSADLAKRGTSEPFTTRCRTLRSLMEELDHQRIDVLKLDIEGSEYEVLESMLKDGVEVDVLCVEFHRSPGIRKMNASVSHLEGAGFVPVHLQYFDVTFVSRKLFAAN